MQRKPALLVARGWSAGMAARLGVATALVADTNAFVTSLAAGLLVGEPVSADRLVLFPLLARDGLREPASRIVTLEEATARGWISLRAAAPAPGWPGVSGLMLDSWADASVFVPAGDELPGRLGMTVARDVLAPPGARGLLLPLVEARREPSVVGRCLAGAIPAGSVGVIATAETGIVRLDLFPSAWFLVRMLRPTVEAATPARHPIEREQAEDFLRRLGVLPWERREPVGLGLEIAASGSGLDASALLLGGALVHLAAVSRYSLP